jgi:RHS repeat-associated protein
LPRALSFFLSLLLLLQAGVFTAHEMKVYLDRDNTGSTLARTDDSGKVIGHAGVQTDPNGLLNMRARYYSPYLMRFLNADPSGFSGFSGGPNWFAYADGNPISKSVPFGLDALFYTEATKIMVMIVFLNAKLKPKLHNLRLTTPQ